MGRYNGEGWDSDDDGGLLIGGPSPGWLSGTVKYRLFRTNHKQTINKSST